MKIRIILKGPEILEFYGSPSEIYRAVDDVVVKWREAYGKA